jgi:hypothetical protein
VAGEGPRESGGTGAVLGKLPFVNRATVLHAAVLASLFVLFNLSSILSRIISIGWTGKEMLLMLQRIEMILIRRRYPMR